MTVALEKLSFQDYLSYNDGTDTRYELVNGELVAMNQGTGKHGSIAEFIYEQFKDEAKRLKLGWTAKLMMLGVRSPQRGRWDTSRVPDVVVLPTVQWKAMAAREAMIEIDEPEPLLVVEVVSPSTVKTDYRAKRAEYNVRNIEEYWIVDPLKDCVTVCLLIDGLYESTEYSDEQVVESQRFPELKLTVAEILAA